MLLPNAALKPSSVMIRLAALVLQDHVTDDLALDVVDDRCDLLGVVLRILFRTKLRDDLIVERLDRIVALLLAFDALAAMSGQELS